MSLLFAPYLRATDQSNAPISGAFLSFYATQTSTPQPIYADVNLTIPLQNPLPSDSNGVFPAIWLDESLPSYKVILSYPDVDDPTIPGAIVAGPYGTVDPYNAQFDALFLAAQLNPQTMIEANQVPPIVPTHYQYLGDPYVDPRRYGAKFDQTTDDTVSLQTALNIAYAANCKMLLPGIALTGPLSLTMTNSGQKGITIEGTNPNGSGLIAKSGLTNTALLTLTSGAPATTIIQAYVFLRNFRVFSPAVVSGVHGISLQGIANWSLSGVRIRQFDRNLDLESSLVGVAQDGCEFISGNYGIYARLVGTSNTTNLIKVEDCLLDFNTQWAIDYNGGTDLQLYHNDIENNGTSGNTSTGAVMIRGQIAPDSLVGEVIMEGNWFESNNGWTIYVESPTLGQNTLIALKGGEVYTPEAGQVMNVVGCTRLTISDLQIGSGGSTVNVNQANFAFFSNFAVNTLNDAGITTPFYANVLANGLSQPNGRVDSTNVLTLTGVTGTVTYPVNVIQQGDSISLRFPYGGDLIATSNATAMTLTGFPAKYRPGANSVLVPVIVRDNATDSVQLMSVSSASSTITFYKGGSATGFTNTGGKGIQGQVTAPYRLTG